MNIFGTSQVTMDSPYVNNMLQNDPYGTQTDPFALFGGGTSGKKGKGGKHGKG